jgi:hypothetical protein
MTFDKNFSAEKNRIEPETKTDMEAGKRTICHSEIEQRFLDLSARIPDTTLTELSRVPFNIMKVTMSLCPLFCIGVNNGRLK